MTVRYGLIFQVKYLVVTGHTFKVNVYNVIIIQINEQLLTLLLWKQVQFIELR